MKTGYDISYWTSKGKYQRVFDAIYQALVPAEGEAKTKAGEIVRLAANIYYEYFNNGGSFFAGQRADESRELVKMVKGIKYPKKDDYAAWDAMIDRSTEAAWLSLLTDPDSLLLVMEKLKNPDKE